MAHAELYEHLARVGKALGSGVRLTLIELLAQGPRGVIELSAAAGLKVSTASAQLQTLRHAGLVRTEREGTTVRYRLADDDVLRLYNLLLEVAAHHVSDVEVSAREVLGPDDVRAIDRVELLRLVSTGEAVVVDVRPAAEYSAAHIPGAVSVPLVELAERMDELPHDVQIVAYCRGRYCEFSHEAVRLLTERGRSAARLVDGIVEWRLAGQPVTGPAA